MSNHQIPNEPVPNKEVLVDYVLREEWMTEGVIGANKYLASHEYDEVDPILNVALFARSPWFGNVALHQDRFCDRYTTN